jgi:hypothetical protein
VVAGYDEQSGVEPSRSRGDSGSKGESECEEERVEEDFSTATTRDGIRLCPRGMAVYGHHHVTMHNVTHTCWQPV